MGKALSIERKVKREEGKEGKTQGNEKSDPDSYRGNNH